MSRKEEDFFGKIDVPKDAYYGSQTQRALNNFQIGHKIFPCEFIRSLVLVKKAAFEANSKLGELDLLNRKETDAVLQACDEIIKGDFSDQFPLSIWQSGSGTQTHMNAIEVITNRANEILGGKLGSKYPIHTNDHINHGQSTNDVFPTAMHIATLTQLIDHLLPEITSLKGSLEDKANKWMEVIKIGRTHLQDATPISVGQEFSAYVKQLEDCIFDLQDRMEELYRLPIGGTAVGTGLNTCDGYDDLVVDNISKATGLQFEVAENKFALMASHDSFVAISSSLKRVAVVLTKIANDIRLLGSGPNCGIGELILPHNEPGSSIMPSKINPTQCEAISMICARVIGNDTTITIAGSQGHLQLNVYKPLIIYYILESIEVLAEGMASFNKNCIIGMKLNREQIDKYVENSLMLVTALNKHIGYEKSAEIAQLADKEKITLREAATKLSHISAKEFDKLVRPDDMV